MLHLPSTRCPARRRRRRGTLRPRPTINAGYGLGRGRSITLKGGAVGIILDARGRPLALPKAPEKRYEAVQAWQARLGGA